MNTAHVTIRPITLADVAGFRACVGAVMSERKYLAYLEPFSFTHTAAFVAENLERGNPHLVAEDAGEIVGWCDVRRETIPTYAHEGMLGMGLLPDYRGRGLGERLMRATLEAARVPDSSASRSPCMARTPARPHCIARWASSTKARASAAGRSTACTTTFT